MSKMACMMVNGVITLVDTELGKTHQVGPDNVNYAQVRKLLGKADNVAELRQLVDVQTAIAKFSDGKVTVVNGSVLYDSQEVHSSISKRIVEFMKEGLPFEPLVKFLGKLMKNPSSRAVNELYDFLEHKNLPITEDGDFLAYKAIKSNWMDKYSGTMDNSIGKVVTMTRNAVDDNREQHCSKGLHCGALDYVRSYGNGSTDRIVIVKVDPADAVSVPSDCSCQKLRTCRYEVVKEFVGELGRPLYNSSADSYEDDYEDEDDDYGVYDSYWDNNDDDYWDEGDVSSY